MRKKYRINHVNLGECIATVCDGDIIELEELEDCPASECDGEECECDIDYTNKGMFKKGIDPEVTCWHCGSTHLCDCMDATCWKCKAPYAKDRCKEFNFKQKEPNESLEEKFNKIKRGMTYLYPTARLAQIAKEHYQEHPEELWGDNFNYNKCIATKDAIYFNPSMVNLSEVLRVFDESRKEWNQSSADTNICNHLRASIEALQQSKDK